MSWESRRRRHEATTIKFATSQPLTDFDNDEFWEGCDVQWRWSMAGFDFSTGVDVRMRPLQIERGVIPYWSIVVPLTLLSAYLLLRKHHPPKSS